MYLAVFAVYVLIGLGIFSHDIFYTKEKDAISHWWFYLAWPVLIVLVTVLHVTFFVIEKFHEVSVKYKRGK